MGAGVGMRAKYIHPADYCRECMRMVVWSCDGVYGPAHVKVIPSSGKGRASVRHATKAESAGDTLDRMRAAAPVVVAQRVFGELPNLHRGEIARLAYVRPEVGQ